MKFQLNVSTFLQLLVALGKELHHLKKPLGRKANERLVTLVTAFKGGHICQILAPFFNLCIELLPLDYFWSFSIFLFDVLA